MNHNTLRLALQVTAFVVLTLLATGLLVAAGLAQDAAPAVSAS